MVKDINDQKSFATFKQHKSYDLKKGIVFGAMGGFVAAIGFTGLILFTSVLFMYPEGIFFDSLGLSISGSNNTITSIGLGAFAIVLIQGIIIGIILGIITSAIKSLNPSSKNKGIGLGLLTGIISYIILYLPMVYMSSAYQNLLNKTLSIFSSSTFLFTRGTEIVNLNLLSNHMPIEGMLIWGIISYLVYGFITGGIITLAYSVYNFDRQEIEQNVK